MHTPAPPIPSSPTISEPTPRRPIQLPALTSIRFLAALHVALYHMVRPFSLWGPFTGIAAAGYTGVSFFFLLSGYILTYSHAADGRHPEPGAAFRRRFYFARFARIYPAYLVALLFAGYILRVQFHPLSHGLAFVADLLLVQTWSLRMVSFFNVPAWSVSSEVFFYAVFPWVVFALRPASRKRALLGVAAFWLLAMAMPVISLLYAPQEAWHEGAGLFAFWVRRFPLFALPEFLAGISLGWFYVRFRPSARTALWLSAGGAAGLLIALYFADDLPAILLHNGLLLPLYALLLVGLSESTWLSRALAARPLVVLGEASYALYLTHFLLNDWLERTFHTGSGFSALPLKLTAALAIALLLHFVVERPCQRRICSAGGGTEHRRDPETRPSSHPLVHPQNCHLDPERSRRARTSCAVAERPASAVARAAGASVPALHAILTTDLSSRPEARSMRRSGETRRRTTSTPSPSLIPQLAERTQGPPIAGSKRDTDSLHPAPTDIPVARTFIELTLY